MKLAEMKALYIKASKVYYNTKLKGGAKLLMTDAEFNALEAKIAKLDPKWEQLKKTGIAVDKKTEIALTFFMPSLNKRYPHDVEKWLAKRPRKYVWSHKLDGNALQGTYSGGRWTQLVTRGNGTLGGDISFLIPYLNLPKLRANTGAYVFRFEAIMKAETFDKKWSVKALGEEKGFDNARNLVSGALNSQKAHKCLKDIDFVVLGVYGMDYLDGLEWADDQGLKVVQHDNINNPSAQDLMDRLRSERKRSVYEMDGLVLVPFDELFQYDNADKPKHSIAFKINEVEDMTETVVEEVVWQLSRTGRWTPKIKVRPVKLKGVTVTYATAHNAQWMNERGIGVGAVVGIVRSGDVIPKIETVVKKAKKPSYPPGDYEVKGVHYVAVGDHKDADVRAVHHFFATLGIDHIAEKTIGKLHDAGLATVQDFMSAHKTRLKAYAELLGDGMRNKIANEMRRVLDDEGVSLIKIMNASNCFESFGERRLQMIHDHFVAHGEPDILRKWVKQPLNIIRADNIWAEVKEIKGFKDATIKLFLKGLEAFNPWFRAVQAEHPIKINKPVVKAKKAKAGGKFAGQFVSWTGYRSKEQEAEVEAQGGEIIKLGAKTNILFYNPSGKFMDKVEAARAKGIKVLVWK